MGHGRGCGLGGFDKAWVSFEKEVGGERIDALEEDSPLSLLCKGVGWRLELFLVRSLCGEMILIISYFCS